MTDASGCIPRKITKCRGHWIKSSECRSPPSKSWHLWLPGLLQRNIWGHSVSTYKNTNTRVHTDPERVVCMSFNVRFHVHLTHRMCHDHFIHTCTFFQIDTRSYIGTINCTEVSVCVCPSAQGLSNGCVWVHLHIFNDFYQPVRTCNHPGISFNASIVFFNWFSDRPLFTHILQSK